MIALTHCYCLPGEQVAAILAEMRKHGASFGYGGSRANTTIFWGEGGWQQENFDEGAVARVQVTEDEVREAIRDYAHQAALLRAGDLRACREALGRGDEAVKVVIRNDLFSPGLGRVPLLGRCGLREVYPPYRHSVAQ